MFLLGTFHMPQAGASLTHWGEDGTNFNRMYEAYEMVV